MTKNENIDGFRSDFSDLGAVKQMAIQINTDQGIGKKRLIWWIMPLQAWMMTF